jgi:hypothetical protein
VYSGLASASQLQPNTEDNTGRVPYRYKSNVSFPRSRPLKRAQREASLRVSLSERSA